MSGDLDRRLLWPLVFLVAISLQSFSGLADNPPNSKGVVNSEAKPTISGGKSGLLICLGVLGAAVLAVCLSRFGRKRREKNGMLVSGVYLKRTTN